MNYVGKQLIVSITQNCTDQFTGNVQYVLLSAKNKQTESCSHITSMFVKISRKFLARLACHLFDNYGYTITAK